VVVELGLGSFVLADEIVAIHDGCQTPDRAPVPFVAWDIATKDDPQCWLLLRSGHLVPGYAKPATIRRRWQDSPIDVTRLEAEIGQAIRFGGTVR
jgi:hypothetical protein